MQPEYEEITDDNNSICPYCKHSYQVEGEDYSEDRREVECDECGEKYWLSQTFTVTHTTTPDCVLNGEDHRFEAVSFKNGRSAEFCTVCDKIKSRSRTAD